MGNAEYMGTRVRVIERNVMTRDVNCTTRLQHYKTATLQQCDNVTLLDLHFDIPTQLRSGSLRNTTSLIHREGKSSWNITVDYWTFLLPNVELISDKSSSLQLVPSLFTQTNCTDSGDYGVFSFFLHRAENLTIPDNDLDVYVIIKLDGTKVMKTERGSNGKNQSFDIKFERLFRHNGNKIENHVVEVEVWDWDRWSGDDAVGTARITLDKTIRINEAVTVFKDGLDRGTLFVSVIFRPVPF